MLSCSGFPGSAVALHTARSGTHEIHLPRRTSVWDVMTGKRVAFSTSTIRVEVADDRRPTEQSVSFGVRWLDSAFNARGVRAKRPLRGQTKAASSRRSPKLTCRKQCMKAHYMFGGMQKAVVYHCIEEG